MDEIITYFPRSYHLTEPEMIYERWEKVIITTIPFGNIG